jgi:hypothetical protein
VEVLKDLDARNQILPARELLLASMFGALQTAWMVGNTVLPGAKFLA